MYILPLLKYVRYFVYFILYFQGLLDIKFYSGERKYLELKVVCYNIKQSLYCGTEGFKGTPIMSRDAYYICYIT